MMSPWLGAGFFCAILCTVPGCQRTGPDVVAVEGVVKRHGEPVPNLHINFMPVAGRPSWGVADESGRFQLKYDRQRDGAEVGVHKIFVSLRPANPTDEMDIISGKKKVPPEIKAIEAKYGKLETTPLQIEVKRDGGLIVLDLD